MLNDFIDKEALSPWSLRFQNDYTYLEKKYREKRLQESLLQIRSAIFLGAGLYLSFIFLDRTILSSVGNYLTMVRLFVCSIGLGVMILTFFPSGRKYLHGLVFSLVLVAGISLVLIIYLSRDLIGVHSDYVSLTLLFTFVYHLSRLRFIWATLASFITLVVFEFAVFYMPKYNEIAFVQSHVFLLGINMFGMFSCYYMEFFNRKAFFANEKLEEEKKKSEAIATEMKVVAQERTQQLIHSDRLALLGTLTAGIGHELKNPLTYVHNGAKLLGGDFKRAMEMVWSKEFDKSEFQILSGVIGEEISMIQSGTLRMKKLLEAMHELVRKETKKELQILDLKQSIRGSIDFFKAGTEKHLSISENIPKHPVFSSGIKEELEQVFLNILTNANDQLSEQDKEGQIIVSLEKEDGKVRVIFDDNGPGISEELKKKIWNPFVSHKEGEKNTGLGLFISKVIIESFNGNIWVEDNSMGGARFIIELVSK